MRAGLMACLAFVLSACVARDGSIEIIAPRQISGAWRIERAIDRITGDPLPRAWVNTVRTTFTRDDILSGATVGLTCFEKRPIIRLRFEVKIGSDRHSTVAYRLDDRPGHELEATILPDQKTIVIDDEAEVTRFMEDVVSSSMLLVRVNSLFAGRSTAEFRVHGAPPAVEAVMTACPFSKPQPQPAPQPKAKRAVARAGQRAA